jgi:glycine/serine hydroxymethyltransferase
MLQASAEMPTPSLKIIISGNRPIDLIAKDKSRLVFIDGRLKDLQNKIDPALMPWISDNWRLHFRYAGSAAISAEERQKLRDYVNRVHASGAQLRFWATPENEELWKVLRDESVDFIGTDQIERLSNFLR